VLQRIEVNSCGDFSGRKGESVAPANNRQQDDRAFSRMDVMADTRLEEHRFAGSERQRLAIRPQADLSMKQLHGYDSIRGVLLE
jgi:hypothetical protein